MYKKQIKVVTEKKEVIIAAVCDCCKKESPGDSVPFGWHEFTAYHSEWGNDSADSIEGYLACSPECYIRLLKKAASEFEGYKSAEIGDMTLEFVVNLIDYLDKP